MPAKTCAVMNTQRTRTPKGGGGKAQDRPDEAPGDSAEREKFAPRKVSPSPHVSLSKNVKEVKKSEQRTTSAPWKNASRSIASPSTATCSQSRPSAARTTSKMSPPVIPDGIKDRCFLAQHNIKSNILNAS